MSDTKQTTLPQVMTIGDLNKAIDSANRRAKGIMDDYQEVGVQALMHLQANGDVGPINRILAGMPKGSKVNAMASWAMAHGALEVNKDAATKKSMPLRYTKSKLTNVEAAIEDKWFDHLPEKAIDEVFDLSKAIAMILAKCDGKQVKVHGVIVDAEAATAKLTALRAFAEVK